MLKLDLLPDVSFSILNLLCDETIQSSFSSKVAPIFDKIFQCTVESLSISPVVRTPVVSPYIFYIDHLESALEFRAPELFNLYPELPKGVASEDFSLRMHELKEEHLALQLVGILKEMAVPNHNIAFRGKVKEEDFLEANCIEIEFLYTKNSMQQKGYINLFLPRVLNIEKQILDCIESPLRGIAGLESLERVNIQIFLGILYVEPISLVDIFSVGSSFRVPENMSFSECFMMVEYETAFMGFLHCCEKEMVFKYRNGQVAAMKGGPSGYSSVYLRVYTGEIGIERIINSYPYFSVDACLGQEVDMLIGGELVSRGILEQREDGMFIKVC